MPDGDTVMVIEDEDQAARISGRNPNFEGFNAVGFSNGAEALDYLHDSAVPASSCSTS